jgi:hypothetical protein
MRRSPQMDAEIEGSLAGVEMYDDAAILAIFHSAVKTHQTKRPKINGEAGIGGLSRKQKKKALREGKDLPAAGEGSAFADEQSDLSHLDDFNRNFVESFLQVTSEPDGDGVSEGTGALRAAPSAAGAEGLAEQQWRPVEGGPYQNCQITVQHHHHYHAHPPGPGEKTPPAASWTQQRAQAWAEVCVAREAYDAALDKFESVSAACVVDKEY